MICRKRFWLLCALLALNSTNALAVTINFSALLIRGTCSFSLDKSLLPLGYVARTQLKPATLIAVQPFTLWVRDCNLSIDGLLPVVSISGEGVLQGGKWLFRSGDSAAKNVGVMLVKSDVPPSYSEPEVKSGDTFPLAARGVNPVDQPLRFYAGMTCGADDTCAEAGLGLLTARVLFTLSFR
ncbi:fimbrial protein [Serratia aquatilis]|uniref:Fimbrial protein n=1 Tax=Serratia aquatilis TaxID=1737515 RepID=A0ABV6EH81_9GAMM